VGLEVLRASDRAALAGLYASGWDASAEVQGTVSRILADVRARGDEALVEYTRRFDAPAFTLEAMRVAIPSLAQARRLVPPEIAQGLELAHERVAAASYRAIWSIGMPTARSVPFSRARWRRSALTCPAVAHPYRRR
jgi:histidinol dehydrogenase